MHLNRPAPKDTTVHLFPKSEGWILVIGDKAEEAAEFPDLGKALDAATAGNTVHVVVHEKGAA